MATKIVRTGLDEVIAHFNELEDPRSLINRQHPLVSVVVIALMGVLAGAGGPTAIARWAKTKKEFLLDVLDLPAGIPGKDVFRRVLMLLQPAAFQACFFKWLQTLRAQAAKASGVEQPVLAVDGKTNRRSHDHDNGLGALHSVSVWASEFGLALGQVACAEKSNEITAIPELLRLVDIQGAIITIDAMGTQKAIAEQIIDRKADYVLALKGNQERLHQAVIENSCHWSLDFTFREDESRIRERNLRENFAWLNRFVLSLLKQLPGRDSIVIKTRRRANCQGRTKRLPE